MSLYNYAKNVIKDCPELLLATDLNSDLSSNSLKIFYKNQERIFPIKSYLNYLLYDSMFKLSSNNVQYEVLRQKLIKISLFEENKIK